MRARDGNRYRDRRCPAACQSLAEREKSNAQRFLREAGRARGERGGTVSTLRMIYSASKGTCRFNEQILRQCALPSPADGCVYRSLWQERKIQPPRGGLGARVMKSLIKYWTRTLRATERDRRETTRV